MTDLVSRYHIQDALDRLEKKYPKAFENSSDLLEDYVPDYIPKEDPAMVNIRKFMAEMVISDRYAMEQERREAKIQSAIVHYQTIEQIAYKMHEDAEQIMRLIEEDPVLRDLYYQKQKDKHAVIMHNLRTGKEIEMKNYGQAADYIHAKRSYLKRITSLGRTSKPINGWVVRPKVTRRDKNWQG